MDDYSCRRTGGVLGAAGNFPSCTGKTQFEYCWTTRNKKRAEKRADQDGLLQDVHTTWWNAVKLKSVTWVMSSLFGVTKTPASRVGIDGYGWWWSRLLFNGILLGVAGYSWIGLKEKDCWVVVTGWLRRLRCLGKYCGGCVVYCQVNLEIQYCLRFSGVASD